MHAPRALRQFPRDGPSPGPNGSVAPIREVFPVAWRIDHRSIPESGCTYGPTLRTAQLVGSRGIGEATAHSIHRVNCAQDASRAAFPRPSESSHARAARGGTRHTPTDSIHRGNLAWRRARADRARSIETLQGGHAPLTAERLPRARRPPRGSRAIAARARAPPRRSRAAAARPPDAGAARGGAAGRRRATSAGGGAGP